MRTGGGELPETTAWYKANQKKIEAGYTAAWAERKNDDEVSAIQHALNLMQDRGKDIFDAEYQNDPQPETSGDDWHISALEIAAKVSGLNRGVAPLWTNKITAFCDIQQRVLYYAVVAWQFDDIRAQRGSIIEYGTWPGQKAREFNYKDVRDTLARKYPKRGIKGAIKAGLADLTNTLLERDWKKEDGTLARIAQMGIDAGNWTNEVHEFIRTSKMAALLMPCKGKGITADKNPISEWRKKPSEQIGEEWILTPQPKHASRLLTFDTNYHKRELFIRLATPSGDPGELSLFGNETVLTHRMIASHFHGETFTKTEGQGRTVFVFSEKPGRPDNHLFDCAVGSLVMTMPGRPKKKRRRTGNRVSYL
jgi:phage terminase large subunit GpA-like protein